MGDRRGVLLLLLEAGSVGGLVALAAIAGEGINAALVFIALAGFFVVWAVQAGHAYRAAVAHGYRPGGQVRLALLAPLAAAALTGFWVLGGRASSPAAALQGYVAAWEDGRPRAALALLATRADAATLDARWREQERYLRERIASLAAHYGPASGLDPTTPFASLSFQLEREPAGGAGFSIAIMRRETVRGSFFGFPTASQRVVTAELVGEATLVLSSRPVAGLPLADRVWRIEKVSIGSDGPAP